MKSTIACSILVLACAVPLAGAEDKAKPHPVSRALTHADGDHNGQVTFDELHTLRPNLTPEQFKKLDVNADSVLTAADVPDANAGGPALDGKLSREEAKKALPQVSDGTFDTLDRNDDGVISGQDRQGEGQQARMRDRLHHADLDHDGKVTYQEARQEFPEMTEDRFKRFDRSGDGYLTQEDVPKRGERPPLAERIRKADANGDGNVTFEEARAEFVSIDEESFKRIDRDGDGVVTTRDVEGALKAGAKPLDPVKENAAAKALTADGNGDGKVSFDELIAAKPGYPREAFDRIDQDKDGFVTAEEAAKAP